MTNPTDAVPDITQFNLTPIPIDASDANPAVLGYYVNSTAAINIEDNNIDSNPLEPYDKSVIAKIHAIADYLTTHPEPQIVISIHGYGTQRSDAEARYQKIYRYAAKICQPSQTTVFLGYLWPSEKPTGDRFAPTGDRSVTDNSFVTKIRQAFGALPILLSGFFWGSLFLSLTIATLLIITNNLNGLLAPVLTGSVLVCSVLLTLILLRLSTYFRDHDRATNYGVADLVDLIRYLNQAISEKQALKESESEGKRIKLSFLGHSMGCFIVPNTVRILADVFDARSIGQNPTTEIGRVFRLERLILVAPDVPAEYIMPRRSNFLRSALRRCKEAYVFTNEGDLALRLASTAANYFSFPARKRSGGYRLGNVTAKHFSSKDKYQKRVLQKEDYGIVNLKNDGLELPFKCLDLRASNHEHQTLEELRGGTALVQKEHLTKAPSVIFPADLLTYFDCTDYVDAQGDATAYVDAQGQLVQADLTAIARPKPLPGVVSFALRKAALSLIGYTLLNISYFKQSLGFGGVNVHGGYFDGIWSQQVMYGLVFLGFQPFLRSLPKALSGDDPDTMKHNLDNLSKQCQQRGIQVVLSPTPYQTAIKNASIIPATESSKHL